ncbi:MAG TPA: cytochrome C, partial [Desulfobulbaceae bacterium]|nr:cytochrome C [Desulfobulbaceae bacterium]
MHGWSLAVLLLLQFIQIEIPTPPKATPQDEIKAPKEVMALLKNSCYDCHSNNTK